MTQIDLYRSATARAIEVAHAIRPDQLDRPTPCTCTEMFLPDMPENGRAAGLVGPAVPVLADAPGQNQLLGAMGRRP